MADSVWWVEGEPEQPGEDGQGGWWRRARIPTHAPAARGHWIIHNPVAALGQGWCYWTAAIVTLADLPRTTPAKKRFPAATHEILVTALDPAVHGGPGMPFRDGGFSGVFVRLSPVCVTAQVVAVDEELAVRVVERMVSRCALVPSPLPLEAVGGGNRRLSELWQGVFKVTYEHELLGGHP